MRWTDDHCHLGHLELEDEAAVRAALDAAAAEGVLRLVDVGTDVADSTAAAERAARYPEVWATAGVHPHEAQHGIDGLEALLARPEVRAVGECGLDYHYDHSPRAVQREVFAAQIALAHERSLPLVIHTREAWDDTFSVLDTEGVPERTVVHCFTGGPAEAEESLARGALLSISGIVTFKTAHDVRAAVAVCPLDRVLVETDAPFLTPHPFRGAPNEPYCLPYTVRALAEIRNSSAVEIAAVTSENASKNYGLYH